MEFIHILNERLKQLEYIQDGVIKKKYEYEYILCFFFFNKKEM